MTATKLNNVLYRIAQVTLILPTLASAGFVHMLPPTWWGAGLAAVGIVITLHLTWKIIVFGVMANLLFGDHKVCCMACKKELLSHASPTVVDMLAEMQKHTCVGKE